MSCGIGNLVVDCAIDPFILPVRYVVNYGDNLKNLRRQVDDLAKAKDDLVLLAEREERMGRIILPSVEHWKQSVEDILKEANLFLVEECEDKAKCTHVKARYQRSKKATELAKKCVLLGQKDNFPNTIATDVHPQETWIKTSQDYQALRSRILLVGEIMNELNNVDQNVIVVYGFGGVGKTTLAKDVAREARKKVALFDDVVLVLDVKKKPMLEMLQKEIAECLDLKFPNHQNLSIGANRLYCRIKDKKVLVILDDVLDEIDLEKVGLHYGCKVLMTSRSRRVFLSPKINIGKEFCLQTLDEEESWLLFAKIAGDVVKDIEIETKAFKVAKRCGGLPVLVVTVAAALKNVEDVQVWRAACRCLKNHGYGEEGLLEKAYLGIEWSYNLLDDDTKDLFLFCCALSSNSHYRRDLLKYCFGIGKFSNNVHTVEEVRDKLYTLVAKLKDSCLFLDGDSCEKIKLHDVVRDVGISILKGRVVNIFSKQQGHVLKEWPGNDFLRNCTSMSFSSLSNFCGFPDQSLECPKLEIFTFEQHSIGLHSLPSIFFEEMTALKVLGLCKFNMRSLPSSFVKLTNLKTLCLHESRLEDFSLVGQLRNLEVLSFVYSSFKHLAKEIAQLTRLRLLDLSYCSELKVIAPNILSKLTSLEELNMRNSFNGWDINGNVSISELNNLSHLVTLEIHILNAFLLPSVLFSNKLKSFKILIGDTWHWRDVSKETSSNVLKLKLVESNPSVKGLERLIKKSVSLYLDEMEGVDNIFCKINSEGFRHLKHLHIQNNPHICWGQFYFEPFKTLTSINVQNCPNLKTLFSFSMAKWLSQLEKMEVLDCDTFEAIVKREVYGDDDLRNKFVVKFNKLRSLTLKNLPKLVGFTSKGNIVHNTSTRPNVIPEMNQDSSEITEVINVDFLELFNREVLLPSLETLYLCSITSNILWDDQLSTSSLGWLQNLKKLKVSNCDGLKFLLSSSMASSMVQLKHLEVEKCETLTEIVSLNQGDCAVNKEVELFGKLESMSLADLPNLVCFSSTNQYSNSQAGLSPHYPLFDGMVQFPILMHLVVIGLNKLTTIWHNKVRIGHCHDRHHQTFLSNLNSIYVLNCPNLKNVIPASLAGSLQGLEQLVIEHCGALEEILMMEEEQETNQLIMFEFPKLKFMRFFELPELRSFYGGMHSSKWPSLTHLEVLLGCNNNKVQILANEQSSFHEKCTIDNPCDPMKQPLFLIEEESFPNLKKLTLSAAIEVYDDPITAGSLSRVKDVIVFPVFGVDISSIFLSNCFRYFHSGFQGLTLLNELGIEPEFFDANKGRESIAEHTFGNLSHLIALRVDSIICLTHLWKDNSQPGSAVLPVLPNLEFLYVSNCSRLRSIVSSAISFCNLTHLIVDGCHNLKYLVTYQVAKSLTQLNIMSVKHCNGLVVIVESIDGDDEIVFGKLLYLELISLPSLRSFCSINDHCGIKVPSLKTLMVNECNIELKRSEEGELLQYEFNSFIHETLHDQDIQYESNSFINETMRERDIQYGISIYIKDDETLYEFSKRLLAMC